VLSRARGQRSRGQGCPGGQGCRTSLCSGAKVVIMADFFELHGLKLVVLGTTALVGLLFLIPISRKLFVAEPLPGIPQQSTGSIFFQVLLWAQALSIFCFVFPAFRWLTAALIMLWALVMFVVYLPDQWLRRLVPGDLAQHPDFWQLFLMSTLQLLSVEFAFLPTGFSFVHQLVSIMMVPAIYSGSMTRLLPAWAAITLWLVFYFACLGNTAEAVWHILQYGTVAGSNLFYVAQLAALPLGTFATVRIYSLDTKKEKTG